VRRLAIIAIGRTRRLLFPPRRPGLTASEILEAHRRAWLRIEVRRQEHNPLDPGVMRRIMVGYSMSRRRRLRRDELKPGAHGVAA
jgi:hypothetical protein